MRHRKADEEDTELFDIIIRNAKRLGILSEKILDIQKIESRTLMLDKERFNINEMVRNIINEVKLKENEIEIIFVEPKVDPVIVEADRICIFTSSNRYFRYLFRTHNDLAFQLIN